jgi:small-conductance mechanosensitive channel
MVLLSHPFDIGDDVIVDGVDYKVHKIGLVSSTFLGANGGKVKFLNSALWKKSVINMTRAPEKIIVFNFNLDPNLSIDTFRLLKMKIHEYLRRRPFDYYETFSLEASSESATNVNILSCSLILKCKSYKTKSKKFHLRVEATKVLKETFEELSIVTI